MDKKPRLTFRAEDARALATERKSSVDLDQVYEKLLERIRLTAGEGRTEITYPFALSSGIVLSEEQCGDLCRRLEEDGYELVGPGDKPGAWVSEGSESVSIVRW